MSLSPPATLPRVRSAKHAPVCSFLRPVSPILDALTLADIRGLDLSKCLIPSWDVVADIAAELPNLQRLALK